MQKRPFFSIIIPVSKEANRTLLKKCLNHLSKQDYKRFEVILVEEAKTNLSKSQARNYGANRAKGNYLLHIDTDCYLDKDALEKSADLILRKKAKAIVLHEKVRPENYIKRIRSIERQINLYDKTLATPQLVNREVFNKIGGFDEKVDILDDWSLHFRLKRANIKFYELPPCIYIDETTSLINIIKRKLARGKNIPQLTKRYPEFESVNNLKRLDAFIKNRKILLKDPLASLGLFILKPVEWIILEVAAKISYFNSDIENPYDNKKVAEIYDKLRTSTNYQLYKNYSEKKALNELLYPYPESVLEIGAGTGRITKFLISKKIKVVATEPSDEMLKMYLRYKLLPAPIKLSGEELTKKLSKKYGKFGAVIGVRVIWHIKNRKIHKEILTQAANISKKYVIFDFTERYRHIISYPIAKIYSGFLNKNYYRWDYFFSLGEIKKLARGAKLKIDKKLPLDLAIPFWINILPRKTAIKLFPYIFRVEKYLANIIPPGRWMIKFVK